MGPPEYLFTVEIKQTPLSSGGACSYWQCNVCDSTASDKYKLLDIFEGCLTCGVRASRVTPDKLRKLQAEWEIGEFLKE